LFGRTEEGIALAARSRDLAVAVGDEWQQLRSTHVLANTPGARESGIPLPDDRDLIALAVRLDDPQTEGMVRLGAAYAALGAGDLVGLADQLRHALDLGRRDGLWFLEELAVFVLVIVSATTGRLVTAARLHGALGSALGDPTKVLPPEYVHVYDTVVDGVLKGLGDEAFQAELSGGQLLGWREALRLADDTVRDLGGTAGGGEESPSSLSPREQEILSLIAQGASNKEIAASLGLRPKTVMHHSSSIYRKLGVRSRAEAVTTAFRTGLLDDQRTA
jgi:DNA-binding CsgD family transcriptional regulator